MAKRQRKGATTKRRASTAKPGKARRQVRRPRAPSVVVTPEDVEPVWTGPALQTPEPVQLELPEPRVPYNVGLTFADARSLDMDGMVQDRRTGWMVCKYGCIGFRRRDNAPGFHHYACEYWDREGKDKTPF